MWAGAYKRPSVAAAHQIAVIAQLGCDRGPAALPQFNYPRCRLLQTDYQRVPAEDSSHLDYRSIPVVYSFRPTAICPC